MNIAIFHDFMSSIGGGEKLVLTLAQALDADLYTTDLNMETVTKLGFGDMNIVDLGPLSKTPPLKQIDASSKFKRFRPKKKYDFHIFSGNWSHYSAKRLHPNLLYCHTPVRAFYDLKEWTLQNLDSGLQRLAARVWIFTHKRFNERSIRNVDWIVANSENVRGRVKKFYNRDAAVVNPPVPTKDFIFTEVGDFWLSVNRLYPEKRIDLQLDLFRKLPNESLKMVGGFASGDHSRSYISQLGDVPPNVELLGQISQEELRDLYARCKGFIATAVDEDFGMTPVEAMASGKIAMVTNEGGYRETVVDGETGWLLPPDSDAFAQKIAGLSKEQLEGMKNACIQRSSMFDEKTFITKMDEQIHACLRQR
ncbi:MAG: glycosyltransferase [Thermoplasmata archaeon]|nr:glycosyltransferase [Thermoplasmata archaeon]